MSKMVYWGRCCERRGVGGLLCHDGCELYLHPRPHHCCHRCHRRSRGCLVTRIDCVMIIWIDYDDDAGDDDDDDESGDCDRGHEVMSISETPWCM